MRQVSICVTLERNDPDYLIDTDRLLDGAHIILDCTDVVPNLQLQAQLDGTERKPRANCNGFRLKFVLQVATKWAQRDLRRFTPHARFGRFDERRHSGVSLR